MSDDADDTRERADPWCDDCMGYRHRPDCPSVTPAEPTPEKAPAPEDCQHDAWEECGGGARRCADCGEWLPRGVIVSATSGPGDEIADARLIANAGTASPWAALRVAADALVATQDQLWKLDKIARVSPQAIIPLLPLVIEGNERALVSAAEALKGESCD